MKEEIWKDIKDYEGLYQVSNYGNVRSLDRIETLSNGVKRSRKGRMMKPTKNSDGYLQIQLWKSGERDNSLIHRLVSEAFVPNPNNLSEVNHKDEDKANNCVDNLEWCTRLYNMRYGTSRQRMSEKQSMSVLQIDINTGQVISEYSSLMEVVRQLNINPGGISNCCNGKQKTAYGFKWKYK